MSSEKHPALSEEAIRLISQREASEILARHEVVCSDRYARLDETLRDLWTTITALRSAVTDGDQAKSNRWIRFLFWMIALQTSVLLAAGGWIIHLLTSGG